MPAGRPTDYNQETVTDAWNYVQTTQDEIRDKILIVNIPTIEGLAMHLDVSRSTVYLWADKYPEFSDIIERLQQKQAIALLNNGLGGNYNPTIAKVLLTKHGYTEKQEVDQNIKGGISIKWEEPPVQPGSGQGANRDLQGDK